MYGTLLLKIMVCLREEGVRENSKEEEKKLRPFRTFSLFYFEPPTVAELEDC